MFRPEGHSTYELQANFGVFWGVLPPWQRLTLWMSLVLSHPGISFPLDVHFHTSLYSSINLCGPVPLQMRDLPCPDCGGRFRQGHLNVFFLNHSILLLGPNPCCKLCTFYVVFASHIFRTSSFILQDLTVTFDIDSGNAYTILKSNK